jgi:WD40 repeat protein
VTVANHEGPTREPPVPTDRQDVFISYSRNDIEFVRRLHAALAEAGKDVYVDWEDIPAWSPDWQQELFAAIERADTFLYVLSESSLASDHVKIELEHAVDQGKRIKPLYLAEVKDEKVPEALKRPQWTDFRAPAQFDRAFAELLDVLNTDVDWLQAHTRLLLDANEWVENGEDKSFLLGRTALGEAEAWLTQQARKEPSPTELQIRYIAASREAAKLRRRITIGAILFALAVAVCLAVWALVQRSEAISQQLRAEREALVAQSRELAAMAKERLAINPELSLLLAAEAARKAQTEEAEDSLKQSLLASPVRRTFRAGKGLVNTVAFSPDGKRLLTADPEAARLWDVESGRLVGVFSGHGENVNGAGFDREGKRLAVARDEGGIELWDVASQEVVRRLPGDSFADNAVSFGTEKEPRWVISAGLSGTTHVIDVRTRGAIATFELDANAQSAAMSPDGAHVVVAYVDGPAHIWDVSTEKPVLSLPADGAWSAAYSGDGKRVLTADDDAARVWDAETGTLLAKLSAQSSSLGIISAAFSRDGERVATGGVNGNVVVWDVAAEREVAILKGHTDEVESVAFSRDGNFVASGSEDGSARVWEVEKARRYTRIGANGDHFGGFSWDGKLALAQSSDGTLSAWPVTRKPSPTSVPAGKADGWSFSPDGTRVALWRENGIEIWRPGDWRHVRTLAPESATAKTGSFRSDNRFLVTTDQGEFAHVWDLATGEIVRQLTCKGGGVWHASFGHVDKLLATACLEEVVVWDAESASPSDWTPVKRFAGAKDPYYHVLFSPDSEFILLLRTNNTARVLRTDTWQESSTLALRPLEAHTFSVPGDLLVAAHATGPPTAWDLVKGQRIALFGDIRGRVADVSFTSDGLTLLVALQNGAVQRYACNVCGSVQELLRLAEERRPRPLTSEERALYLHEG